LLLGQAQARLRMNDEPGAAEVFSEVVSRFLQQRGPEALYWLAVSRYKASHEGKDLMGGWHRVQTTYPSSIWRLKQSFIENKQRGE
jgi:TolA-binding protein